MKINSMKLLKHNIYKEKDGKYKNYDRIDSENNIDKHIDNSNINNSLYYSNYNTNNIESLQKYHRS